MPYDASSIKILSPDEQLLFDFNLVDFLAEKYTKPKNYIKRSVEACRLAGVDPRDYFVRRYLNLEDIPENVDVTAISKELQRSTNA